MGIYSRNRKNNLIDMANIFNQILSVFGNPLILIVGFGVVAVFVALFVWRDTLKKSYRVLYLSEHERIADELEIVKITPRQLKCKDNKRFIRNSIAYTLKRGAKTIILWLAKVGTAYTFKAADTPEGKAQAIGTLLEGLTNCLGEEVLDELTPEAKEKLTQSKIFVTVELEKGITPKDLPPLTEEDINTEGNANMAELFGTRIRSALNEHDFIRDIGIAGSGGLVVLILQGLGIIPNFGLMWALLVI